MEKYTVSKIDLKKPAATEVLSERETIVSPASIVLALGGFAMKFARIERVPRYDEQTRENDAEHSFMLALVATELAENLYPGKLDLGLVSQYSIVHDLIELKTGDVATFLYSPEDMATKQQVEHAALEELIKELPPHTARLLKEYEAQEKLEARFVRATDKHLPVAVDIIGPGKKVMAEDYGVTTLEQLNDSQRKLHSRIADTFSEFPSMVEAHALLCELFAIEFETTPMR